MFVNEILLAYRVHRLRSELPENARNCLAYNKHWLSEVNFNTYLWCKKRMIEKEMEK